MIDFALSSAGPGLRFGLAKASVKKAATTHWSSDPFINGAYSCAKPGQGEAREAFAGRSMSASSSPASMCIRHFYGDRAWRLRNRASELPHKRRSRLIGAAGAEAADSACICPRWQMDIDGHIPISRRICRLAKRG